MSYNQRSADRHLILRVFTAPPESAGNAAPASRRPEPLIEVHVHPESRHWFAHVEHAGECYTAELGFYGRARKWTSIAASDVAVTPAETISDDTTAEFATIPVDIPFEKLLELVEAAASEPGPLAHAIEELRLAGHPELPTAAAPGLW